MGAMKPLRIVALAAAGAALWLAPLPAQTPAITAFTDVRLIDGTAGAPLDNATLLVRDGRIVAAGPAARVTIPPVARRVALAGKTMIPGLVNAHGHVGDTEGLEVAPHFFVRHVRIDQQVQRRPENRASANVRKGFGP